MPIPFLQVAAYVAIVIFALLNARAVISIIQNTAECIWGNIFDEDGAMWSCFGKEFRDQYIKKQKKLKKDEENKKIKDYLSKNKKTVSEQRARQISARKKDFLSAVERVSKKKQPIGRMSKEFENIIVKTAPEIKIKDSAWVKKISKAGAEIIVDARDNGTQFKPAEIKKKLSRVS